MIKQDYFYDLEHVIPIVDFYSANLVENDAYDSFSEIFIKQEYLKYLPNIQLNKILDVGANYGFFSLWLQTNNLNDEISSLMIESSPRCKRSLNKLVTKKSFNNKFKWINKAISNPKNKTVNFFDRPFMASSSFKLNANESSTMVDIVNANEIFDNLNPPYDLIKCDIEGSEWEFLVFYSAVLRKSKYILLEWHSWHNGGGGLYQIKSKLDELSFIIQKSSKPQMAYGRSGEVGIILAKNTNFQEQ